MPRLFVICAIVAGLQVHSHAAPPTEPGLTPYHQDSAKKAANPRGGEERPKLAQLIMAGGAVSAKGIWRPDNPTKKNELMEAVTEVTCFPHGGRELVGTEAFCLQVTAQVIDKADEMLDVNTQWLKVIEWNETQIIATDDSPICLTSQTIFDLKRKTVIALDIRKPEAQGFRGACNSIPDRQTYYLQDPVDYYAKKFADAK